MSRESTELIDEYALHAHKLIDNVIEKAVNRLDNQESDREKTLESLKLQSRYVQ